MQLTWKNRELDVLVIYEEFCQICVGVQGYSYGQTITFVDIYMEVPHILNIGNFGSQFDNIC